MTTYELTVGIDIGGTNTKIGLVDRAGVCLQDSSITTDAHKPPDDLIGRLHVAIEELHGRVSGKPPIRGIGIGAPNANYYRGTVENPPNLSWKGVTDVAGLMRTRMDVPVAVTNDANAAALGEGLFGSAKGMKDFMVITLGTGLGSGVVAAGDLVYGSTGFAGELGHCIVDVDGRECGCGRRGCLETYASATGICRTVTHLLSMRRAGSGLRAVSQQDLTAKMIADAAAAGDPIAREAFEFTGGILGLTLANAAAITSPEAIFLFGGLANAGALIFEPTRKALDQHLLNIFHGTVKLLPSGLKEAGAAVLGASALIWKELEKRG
jgi:glucokinase